MKMAPQRRSETKSGKCAAASNPQTIKRSRGRPPKSLSTSSQSKSTCQIKRYSAIEVRVASSKIDKAHEHVDKTKIMSSSSVKQDNIIQINDADANNSDSDDIEMDIYPKRSCTFDDDNKSKRFKSDDALRDDDASEKDSVDLNEMSGASPVQTAKDGEDDTSAALDREDIEPQIMITPILAIEIGDSANEVEVESHDDDEIAHDDADVDADNDVVSDKSEHEAAENTDEGVKIISPNEEFFDAESGAAEQRDETATANGEQEIASPNGDQETADEDVISIFDQDLDFEFDGAEENDQASSSTSIVRVPGWKRNGIVSTKANTPNVQATPRPDPGDIKVTQTLNGPRNVKVICTSQESRSVPLIQRTIQNVPNQVTQIDKNFKIPKRPQVISSEQQTVLSVSSAQGTSSAANVANRDPRVRNTPQITASASTITQTITFVASSTSTSKATNGQRASVKDRLGGNVNRFRLNNGNRVSNQLPPPAINQNSGFDAKDIDEPIDAPIFASVTNSHAQSNATKQTDEPTPDQQPITSKATKPDENTSPPVKKSMVLPSFLKKAPMELKLPSFAIGPQKYEPVFSYLFARTCRYYMHNAPCQGQCPLNHTMPDHHFFRSSLDKMFQKSVIELYDEYMCRNDTLFEFYFMDFCDYFGRNSLDGQLKKMVEDCNERKMEHNFLKIIDGLMLMGRSFTKALIEVIEAVETRRIRTSREICKLILHPRNQNIRPFIESLKSISKQPHFRFQSEWVNRLLLIHKEKMDEELGNVIWSIISDSNCDSIDLAYDPDLLKSFMEHVKKNANIR